MCLDTVQDTTASMCSWLANRSICDHVLYHSADMRWVQRERVWWGWVHMHWLNSPTAPAGDCEMLTVDVSLCALMFPHTNNRPPYFCCLHTPVTPLLLCCFTSHLHESQPQGLTGHLSLCLSFSVSQPWNFTSTSTTWQRRRGWRAGSCIRRWRASHGTSQYWRWEQPWLSFVYLPVWRTSSYHIAGFVTSSQQTDKVKGQSWWANFLLKEFYHHCGHVTVLWKTCTKTVSNCNWSVFLWATGLQPLFSTLTLRPVFIFSTCRARRIYWSTQRLKSRKTLGRSTVLFWPVTWANMELGLALLALSQRADIALRPFQRRPLQRKTWLGRKTEDLQPSPGPAPTRPRCCFCLLNSETQSSLFSPSLSPFFCPYTDIITVSHAHTHTTFHQYIPVSQAQLQPLKLFCLVIISKTSPPIQGSTTERFHDKVLFTYCQWFRSKWWMKNTPINLTYCLKCIICLWTLNNRHTQLKESPVM